MKQKLSKVTQQICDDMLTPIIKLIYPKCMLCGDKTQVAHHHFKKEKSLTLRYVLENLIPLCNGCHFKLRFHESYWACKILEIKGMKWFKKLDKMNQVKIKPDYNEVYKTLTKILNKLKQNDNNKL